MGVALCLKRSYFQHAINFTNRYLQTSIKYQLLIIFSIPALPRVLTYSVDKNRKDQLATEYLRR